MEEELFDGRYEKEKLLGQGAFSEVWKVKDSQTGVALALKIYNPSMGMDEDGIETAMVNLGVNDRDCCEVSVDLNNSYLNCIAEISEQNFTELNNIADWAESAYEEELKKFSAAVQAYRYTAGFR